MNDKKISKLLNSQMCVMKELKQEVEILLNNNRQDEALRFAQILDRLSKSAVEISRLVKR